MAGVTPRGARARWPPSARRTSEISPGRYTLELPPDQPPERVLAELIAAGAQPRLAQPDARHARGFLRQARGRGGLGARRRRRRARRLAASPLSVFRESVRDRVPYNLVLFAVLLIAVVVPARAAHGRAGREDHQGPRPGGDVGLRPVHRHLHRHRPGVEGSRAAQHLRAAGQADQPAAVHRSASTPGSC